MITVFDENGAYTGEGLDVEDQFIATMRRIVRVLKNPRDLHALVNGAATDVVSAEMMERANRAKQS